MSSLGQKLIGKLVEIAQDTSIYWNNDPEMDDLLRRPFEKRGLRKMTLRPSIEN